MPQIYQVKLLKKQEVAEGTMAFHFEKPAGFEYKAGQHIDITLLNPPETDSEGNVRTFTISNSPSQNDLIIATRMRDTAFKRILKSAPEGYVVQINGPFGSFTLHNDVSKPAVFLAGGIGITPFTSIVLDATEKKLPHKLYLFYSNRRPEDAPFLQYLPMTEQQNPNFKSIPTMTDMPAHRSLGEGGEKSAQKWTGETGYITKEMLAKYIPDILAPIYYLAGPPAMVTAMRKMLNDAGINDDNIRAEDFAGY